MVTWNEGTKEGRKEEIQENRKGGGDGVEKRNVKRTAIQGVGRNIGQEKREETNNDVKKKQTNKLIYPYVILRRSFREVSERIGTDDGL